MKRRIPIFLLTHDRPYLLREVFDRILKFTDWSLFELCILDNSSTKSNKRIIQAYLEKYKDIKVVSSEVNNASLIQNKAIQENPSDLYIKLDDDILVTENWFKGFLDVYDRNYDQMSIGSVIMPINGFGWVPFLRILDKEIEFKKKFPDINLVQGCTEPAVWSNNEVCEYIWEQCLDLDKTARDFVLNQNNKFEDLVIPGRYSIGSIVYSHKTWEKMGGWRVNTSVGSKVIWYKSLQRVNHLIAKLRGKKEQKRAQSFINLLTGINKYSIGEDEVFIHHFSEKNDLKQIATTQSLVYHLAFWPTEEYIVKKFLLRIKF